MAAQVPAQPPLLKLPRKIRVAMLGFEGHQSEVLEPARRIPDIEIVAYHDKLPQQMQRSARSMGSAKPYDDYRRLLDVEKPDLVCINNWHAERAEVIVECLDRKIHVVAEKPVATEWKDLERVKKAVEKGPAKLTAELNMRYTPPYMALKQIVDSGELGEIVQIDSQKSYKTSNRNPWWYKRATYGGTIPWIGIHMIDNMMFTTGRNLVEVFSYQNRIGAETGEMENVTDSMFKMDNGGLAVLRMDYLRPQAASSHGDDRLRLAGTKGVAEYMAATGVTVVSAKGSRVVTELPAAQSLFVDFLNHVYYGKPISLTWEQIYRGTQIALAARDAAEEHRIVKV